MVVYVAFGCKYYHNACYNQLQVIVFVEQELHDVSTREEHS
jgi:hypothetical protein